MLYYTRKHGKSQAGTGLFSAEPKTFSSRSIIMKEKTAAALNVLLNLTAENLGFVIVWAVSIAVILKLACA